MGGKPKEKAMKCIVCHGEEVIQAEVLEEIEVGPDIVRTPVAVLECQNCGERYYDRATCT